MTNDFLAFAPITASADDAVVAPADAATTEPQGEETLAAPAPGASAVASLAASLADIFGAPVAASPVAASLSAGELGASDEGSLVADDFGASFGADGLDLIAQLELEALLDADEVVDPVVVVEAAVVPDTIAELDSAVVPDSPAALAEITLPETPAQLESLALLDEMMARVGVDGLAAAYADPGLLALIDQHVAAVRSSLAEAGRAADADGLAAYAKSIGAAAERHGRPIPAAGEAVTTVAAWHAGEWHALRLVAVCAIAESAGLL